MLSGDPFHAACPTIETMGDPFDLAGRTAINAPRFIYKIDRIRGRETCRRFAYDDNAFYIMDTMTGHYTSFGYAESTARDHVWRLNKNPKLRFDFSWTC